MASVQSVPTQVRATQPAQRTTVQQVLETVFPESRLIRALDALNATLQGVAGLTTRAATAAVALEDLLPPLHPPADLLQLLLAGQQQGLARGLLVRVVLQVPAGQPVRVVLTKPDAEVGFFLAQDLIDVAPHSAAFQVTAGEDFHQPTLTGVPLTSPLAVPGTLYYPWETQLVRTITPDPAEDIEYRETLSLVLVTGTYYQSTMRPWLDRNLEALAHES